MAMTAGTVAVDSHGVETFTPNDATNAAKAKYLLDKATVAALWAAQGQPTPVAALQALAVAATNLAGWIVPYLQANAQAKIAADGSGDGLQDGTTHPASDKFLPIV